MPAPTQWKAADLTPAVIKASDGSIRTVTGQRDGSRPSGPAAPEFTTSTTSTSITATITDGKGADSYESRVGSGSWNTGLSVSGLSIETAYTFQVRGIDENGTGPAANVSLTTDAGGVIFSDNFDAQPDWTSGMFSTDRVQIADTHTIPEGWFAVRQDPEWAPSVGNPGGHESIEILASNTDKTRSGTGKSYVSWRDSTIGSEYYRWNSDSILAKHFSAGLNELYVEFWIKFSPDWTPDGLTGVSKIFRVSHWDGTPSGIFGYGGNRFNGPVFFWDYKGDDSNTRNAHAYRGYPIATNYLMTNPAPINLPRTGNTSYNFAENLRDFNNDGTNEHNPQGPIDFVTGEVVDGLVSHAGLWGDWRKIGFYLKMNSAPGLYDGVLKQWIDDYLVFSNIEMPWAGDETATMPKWNVVALGGNDHFHIYPDEDKRQEWYAIDDVLIRDSLPENLL